MPHLRVTSRTSGNWNKTENMLDRISNRSYLQPMSRIGREGVEQLRANTPKDTGLTAESWFTEMNESSSGADIDFGNTNVVNGFNVVRGLVEGHGTGTGGWVPGNDFVNPVGESVFEDMADSIWREVTNG